MADKPGMAEIGDQGSSAAVRGARAVAAATPAGRDRVVDFLRVFAIAAVVFGHWLMAVVTWRGGQGTGANALEWISWAWILTWLLQVMPLFFFVGGFANAARLESGTRRSEGYAGFVRARLERMLRPTVVFIIAWLALAAAARAAGFPGGTLTLATRLVAKPLWFLGIYLAVTALAPAMLALHRRFGIGVLVALGLGAAAIDAVRFGTGTTGIGILNYALVWLFAHQLGFVYRDGRLPGRPAVRVAMAAGGLAAMILLTTVGGYPHSMVGLRGDPFSNMDPPTLALLALTLWEVGAAMLLRAPLARWLARPRAWTRVVAANSVVLTVFLWHLTALVVVAAIALPVGLPQPAVGSSAWWLLRPAWLAMAGVALALLVAVFAWAERGRRAGASMRGVPRGVPTGEAFAPPRTPAARGAATGAAAIGAACAAVGILALSFTGFDQPFSRAGVLLIVVRVNALQGLVYLGAAWALLRATEGGARRARRAAGRLAAGFAIVAAAGPAMAAHPAWNLLAVNGAASLLQAALAVALLAVAARRRGTPAPGEPAGDLGAFRPSASG